MKKTWKWIFVFCLLPIISHSLPSNQSMHIASGLKNVLQKSASDRKSWLQESKINQELMFKLAFEEKYHLQDRWTALQSLASLKNDLAIQSIVKASKSDDWFMRDAALKASRKYYPKASIKMAKKLLNDPSLIVRTSAVKSIHSAGDLDSKSVLWKALYDERNFRKGKGLWVRKHIARALADFETRDLKNVSDKKIESFIKLLKEPNQDIQVSAMAALEKLTTKSFGEKQTPLELKRERWLNWWETK
jgi:HEAT repeat protein